MKVLSIEKQGLFLDMKRLRSVTEPIDQQEAEPKGSI
jgi:hypothetical protein